MAHFFLKSFSTIKQMLIIKRENNICRRKKIKRVMKIFNHLVKELNW